MRTSPSLHLLLAMTDAFGDVSLKAFEEAWDRWIGQKRFERKLADLTDAGWTNPQGEGSLARVVHLTEAGRLAAIGGRDPDARWARPWDGRWRLVLFDIPEEKVALRTALRRKLLELGFGYLQNSVWITPDPATELRQLVAGVEVNVESFTIMDARPSAGETDEQIVNGAWDFHRINKNYAQYLELLNTAQSTIVLNSTRRAWLEVESAAWTRAIRSDPLLPAPLLPSTYLGRDAWRQHQDVLRRMFRRQ